MKSRFARPQPWRRPVCSCERIWGNVLIADQLLLVQGCQHMLAEGLGERCLIDALKRRELRVRLKQPVGKHAVPASARLRRGPIDRPRRSPQDEDGEVGMISAGGAQRIPVCRARFFPARGAYTSAVHVRRAASESSPPLTVRRPAGKVVMTVSPRHCVRLRTSYSVSLEYKSDDRFSLLQVNQSFRRPGKEIAAVSRDITKPGIYAGNPARFLRPYNTPRSPSHE